MQKYPHINWSHDCKKKPEQLLYTSVSDTISILILNQHQKCFPTVYNMTLLTQTGQWEDFEFDENAKPATY